MKGFLDNPVYIITLYSGENAKDISDDISSDNYIGFQSRKIMSVHQTKERAIKFKNRYQKEADENGFGDYDRYFVESCCVFE